MACDETPKLRAAGWPRRPILIIHVYIEARPRIDLAKLVGRRIGTTEGIVKQLSDIFLILPRASKCMQYPKCPVSAARYGSWLKCLRHSSGQWLRSDALAM